MITRGIGTVAKGMQALIDFEDVTAHNLANVTTTGFKKTNITFQDIMQSQVQAKNAQGNYKNVGSLSFGARTDRTYIDFSQGGLQETGYKLDLGTKAIADNLLTKTQANALTTDTVAFIHVLKELNKDNFKSFTVNNGATTLVVNEGDSVEFNIVYNEAIDVQEYSIVTLSEDGKDTTVIVTSNKPSFKVPLKEMEKTTVYPMVSNEIGKVVKDVSWGK